jgi:hypothetical protein
MIVALVDTLLPLRQCWKRLADDPPRWMDSGARSLVSPEEGSPGAALARKGGGG